VLAYNKDRINRFWDGLNLRIDTGEEYNQESKATFKILVRKIWGVAFDDCIPGLARRVAEK